MVECTTKSECARPRAQQGWPAGEAGLIPANFCGRELLRPGTGALRGIGVRPSSGAARLAGGRGWVNSSQLLRMGVAAPGDGRSPGDWGAPVLGRSKVGWRERLAWVIHPMAPAPGARYSRSTGQTFSRPTGGVALSTVAGGPGPNLGQIKTALAIYVHDLTIFRCMVNRCPADIVDNGYI